MRRSRRIALAVVEFTLTDDLARAVVGFYNGGKEGRIVLHVSNRRVLNVELALMLENAVALRTFTPGASGVDLSLTGNGMRR